MSTSSISISSHKKRKRDSIPKPTSLSGNQSEEDVELSLTDPNFQSSSSTKKSRKDEKKRAKKLLKANLSASDISIDSSINKKDKKNKHKKNGGETAEGSMESEFQILNTKIKIPIPPVLSDRPLEAVLELFDTLVLRSVNWK